MKTAPFDLELAKLGHPLVTRGGKEVVEYHCFMYGLDRVRAIVLDGTYKSFNYNSYGKIHNIDVDHIYDMLLDLETPWEKPLQQGEEILCQDKMGAWIPRIFEAEVQSKNIVITTCKTTDFYMAYTKWKRPEPVKQEATKLDITLDVKINGKDISKEDKNKFMDYLKKFVNEVL